MPGTSSESVTLKLKPEQSIAAHTLDRHVSVTAGPGAGKTFVLVERYLEILRARKATVDNIVAITFTNRAANEMRERVRKEIDRLLRTSAGDERRRWLRHKRVLESAVITTIHGFCSRVLREFPVEANIDPQFTLLDEHRSTMMLEDVVEESLTEVIQRGQEKITQITQGLGRGLLATALGNIYRQYRGEGLSIDEIEAKSAANHVDKAAYFSALKELDSKIAIFLSARLTPAAEIKRGRAAEYWPTLRAVLAQPPTPETIATYCQAIEDFREMRPNRGTHPVVDELDELIWGEKSSSSECLGGRLPAIGFDLLAKGYSSELLKLMRSIEIRLEAEKQQESALDFDDLQLRVLDLLQNHPEVRTRITERYRFFLVDEFQDTNGLQRDLMKHLAFASGANLFIVGDRKQSIYGFRGADVDVFVEMTKAITGAGGIEQPLNLNFRSQRALIDAFNFLFRRAFTVPGEIPCEQLAQLGHVGHEPSIAERDNISDQPLVELLLTLVPSDEEGESDDAGDAGSSQADLREREAPQLIKRISALANSGVKYCEIAVLFRALTNVWVYEAALRRAGIPYLTVQGKGFYQRQEIIDLIQLLRFLDNTTDELALAAVLRSPLCGLSDNTLFALRCAPNIDATEVTGKLDRRNLLGALRHHERIAFIEEAERPEVERARVLLDSLVQRRNRYSISELLRYAVRAVELLPVVAANFDGPQRVANIEKLFRLAEQFEKSGNLIRDFVRYVEEFEAIGGREGEGQMDESANVVRLMTIHQAKGLEFPVVMIPELHREPTRSETTWVLDRHKGFSMQIPDGRGHMVRGALFNELRQRNQWREQFESMRLLYVAATRAKDRLIFSGSVEQKSLRSLQNPDSDRWLAWIWQALELTETPVSGTVKFNDAEFQITIDRGADESEHAIQTAHEPEPAQLDVNQPFAELFPLVQAVPADFGNSLRRFSVTQLINFQRCPRQYYFDRLLRAPGSEERSVWNDAEAPEPPANLTATVKGAVIHRFCETFVPGEDAKSRLRTSFQEVVAQRQSELAGRVFEIDLDEAVKDLMPLAENYLVSDVFQRVSRAGRISNNDASSKVGNPQSQPGLWSELRFRLRRELGILTGTIDKLLITPSRNGEGLDVEIIDFKTNRFPASGKSGTKKAQRAIAAARTESVTHRRADQSGQASFDFEAAEAAFDLEVVAQPELSIHDQVRMTGNDYLLQMQAYALALRELTVSTTTSQTEHTSLQKPLKIASLRATLHFLDPNIEIDVAPALLDRATCANAIDQAMKDIALLDGKLDVDNFPPLPATHCRMCKFLDLCPAGRDWLGTHRYRTQTGSVPERSSTW